MSLISFDKQGNISCLKPNSFTRWKAPLATVTIHTLDHLGSRFTLTRFALAGPLALAAKKKSGSVSVIIVTDAGDTFTHKVKAKHGEATLAWAVAFNAWREATQRT